MTVAGMGHDGDFHHLSRPISMELDQCLETNNDCLAQFYNSFLAFFSSSGKTQSKSAQPANVEKTGKLWWW